MQLNKLISQLTIDEAIAFHLNDRETPSATSDFYITSTLAVAKREMRHTILQDRSKNFVPCMAAFAILDQLGGCYHRSDMTSYGNKQASGIKKCLYYFAGFGENDDKTNSLYAFRNAIMHNSSLKNNSYDKKFHHFIYDNKITGPVEPATQRWDGTMGSVNLNTATKINPKGLVEMVANLIGEVGQCHANGTLKTSMDVAGIVGNFLLIAAKT